MTTASVLRGTTFDSRVFAPYIKTAFPAQSMSVSDGVSISAAFYIAAGTSPTWAATGLPTGVTINASTGLISGTVTTIATTSCQITCTNSLGSVSSAAVSWAVATALTWATLPTTINIQQGSFFDFAPYISGGTVATLTANKALPTGVAIALTPTPRLTATSGASLTPVTAVTFTMTPSAISPAQQDWNTRIGDPGVVWYHNFDTANEVNAFRWTQDRGQLQAGNDPNGNLTPQAANCAWISSGGADGGGYLRIRQLAAQNLSSEWIRPFSPLTAPGNGRLTDDPGANNTITKKVWSPTPAGGQLLNWTDGWWGHPSSVNSHFDSGSATKFYLQVRVKTDPNRTFVSSGYGRYTTGGKNHVFTTTNGTSEAQTQVILQTYMQNNIPVVPGMPSYHNAYSHSSGNDEWSVARTSPVESAYHIQVSSDLVGLGVCDPYEQSVNGCWAYRTDGTWDTLLYEFTPPVNGGSGHIKVWAAHQNESSYTKIWDFDLPIIYSQGTNSSGAAYQNGWNAFWCSAYNNVDPGGNSAPDFPQFDMSFDQIIFSKNTIACPQA